MDWFKKHWIMVAIAASLTIVVVILLVYGISNHSEPGLQRVCWQHGQAYYEGEPDLPCDPDLDLVWPEEQLPILIGVEALNDEGRRDGRSTVANAIEVWNHQVGFNVFQLVPEGDDSNAAAIVDWGVPVEVGHSRGREGGWVSHRIDGNGRLLADVGIIHIATNRLAFLVTVHELGHLIGLAHDPYEASLMFPTTTDDSMEDRMRFSIVSSWDRNVLRNTYPH